MAGDPTPLPQRILLVDDDEQFLGVLSRSLERRGMATRQATDGEQALAVARQWLPQGVVLDLRLGRESGLHLIGDLLSAVPGVRILLLTGYASIATAVRAIKLGALDYLTKPVDTDAILAAFMGRAATPEVEPKPLSVGRLRWEHLQRVLVEHDGNISAAARSLKMHRRSLQRMLAKRPPRD